MTKLEELKAAEEAAYAEWKAASSTRASQTSLKRHMSWWRKCDVA
jgi:hypothetical protein